MIPDVYFTDSGFDDQEIERRLIENAGGRLTVVDCTSSRDVQQNCAEANALLVQWAVIDRPAIDALRKCELIVRVGIGVDNVDIDYADRRGITVCNVPDYCIEEVTEHTIAMAAALLRDLANVDRRVRSGVWAIQPTRPVRPFSDITFVVVGFGRIGQSVCERARHIGFHVAAVDPAVDEVVFDEEGVERWTLARAFEQADVLSLHCALNDHTRGLVNGDRLATSKKDLVVINTSRGGLIDETALAAALNEGRIAGAGLDVFETEPLPSDHVLRETPNTLLTSHTAWYSASSVEKLRTKAAEEVARWIKREPLRNPLN